MFGIVGCTDVKDGQYYFHAYRGASTSFHCSRDPAEKVRKENWGNISTYNTICSVMASQSFNNVECYWRFSLNIQENIWIIT